MHSVWLLRIILFVMQCKGENDQDFKDYKGCQVWSVTPQTSNEFNYIKKLYKTNVIGIEFWRSPIATNRTVSLQLCPNTEKKVKQDLKKMKHAIEIQDIQKNIDAELNVYKHLRHFDSSALTFEDFKCDQYHSLKEIYLFINIAQKKYPKIMKVETIGTTFRNNSLRLIKLMKKPKKGSTKKKIFWLDSGTHAREWVTIASVLYILKLLLSSNKPDIKSLLEKFDYYILVVVNPDGYKFSWFKHQMWRKNKSRDPKQKCIGVDLNRNYDIDFYGNAEEPALEKRSRHPCLNNYRGPKPFSEKETQAIRDAMYKIKGDLQVFVTVHSYSQMIALPYGYTAKKPKTYEQLYSMATKMVKAIKALYGTVYKVGTIHDIIDPTSGISVDWVYDLMKVKYCYGVELGGKRKYGFLPPRSEIIPTAKELLVAIQVLVKNIV